MRVSDSLLCTTGIDGERRSVKIWDYREGDLKINLDSFEKTVLNLAEKDSNSIFATSG
jgi:hypothetical protein